MPLEGKHAVVTGGGRGIGAAIASSLAQHGVGVIVAARTISEIEHVANTIRDGGGKAHAVRCDVTREEDILSLGTVAAERLGTIDILVNNAGVAHSAPIGKTELDAWNRLLAVNATGTFLCTRAFIPNMIERGWGRVVNIASVAGVTGDRYVSAYSASKHAVLGLTRSVAAEVAGLGVTVNALCPGYVDTGMTEASVDRISATTGRSQAEALDAILDTTPQHRLISPREVAHMAVALCHDDAASINGETIIMDGGQLRA